MKICLDDYRDLQRLSVVGGVFYVHHSPRMLAHRSELAVPTDVLEEESGSGAESGSEIEEIAELGSEETGSEIEALAELGSDGSGVEVGTETEAETESEGETLPEAETGSETEAGAEVQAVAESLATDSGPPKSSGDGERPPEPESGLNTARRPAPRHPYARPAPRGYAYEFGTGRLVRLFYTEEGTPVAASHRYGSWY